MNRLFAALLMTAVSALVIPALAVGDEEACLECHEPAEDWEGMSVEEILVEARNPDNKRHKDNGDLSDDQLKAIILVLVPE